MKQLLYICLFILFLFSQLQLSAQGKVDARIVKNYFSCDSLFMYLDLEIKANSSTSTFNVADLSFRFSFKRAAFHESTPSNPTVTLVQELTLSGFISGNGYITGYDPHTLLGSNDTVVSYNIILAGGDGYPVLDTGWVSIGRVGLQVKDLNACSNIKIHTEDSINYPPLFVSEKISNGLFEVDHGILTNPQYCFPSFCSQTPVANLLEESSLHIYPTITSDQVTIAFKEGWHRTDQVNIKLYSLIGRLIVEETIGLSGSGDIYQMSLQNVPAGAYFLSLSNESGASYAERIVKQ